MNNTTPSQDKHLLTKGPLVQEIDSESIKFIAAGEKINDIETAIRELVENSIDSGAKNIEIRLARFGVDAIEVEDNGTGIDEKNFGSLGKRYHTSKINDYSRLQNSLETFGFRGEALSCLCSIAQVTITTKTKTSPTGWKLTFKPNNLPVSPEPVGRNDGTTVILKNLFHSLPVRRRELETTAKKQYDKVVKLIYEHVLARPFIKFSLCKKSAARKEKDITCGGTDLESAIISMFGIKVLDSLMPIKQFGICDNSMLENETPKQTRNGNNAINGSTTKQKPRDNLSDAISETQNFPTTDDDVSVQSAKSRFSQVIAPNREDFFKRTRKSKFARERPEYMIYGYISKVGAGGNSNDCQFIFVNKKPCEIPKLSRLVNETYKSFNNNHYPFFCLFIEVQNWAADFNVPRKRAVILQEENKLCDIVKESLVQMFTPYAPGSQRSCSIAQIPMLIPKQSSEKTSPKQVVKREFEHDNDTDSDTLQPCKKQSKLKNDSTIDDISSDSDKQQIDDGKSKQDDRLSNETLRENVPVSPEPQQDDIKLISIETEQKNAQAASETMKETNQVVTEIEIDSDDIVVERCVDYFLKPGSGRRSRSSSNGSSKQTDGIRSVSPRPNNCLALVPSIVSALSLVRKSPISSLDTITDPCRFAQIDFDQDKVIKSRMDFMEDISMAFDRERAQRKLEDDSKEFSFAIHPKFNTVAEEELKFHLDKTSFKQMRILGQFNKGFIITRLNKHLFIIDQHATDERANFEEQLENYPLVRQPMVYPKPLLLNLIKENAIMDNIEAFRRRGFEFIVDHTKLVGYRVMLASTSICKGVGMDEHLGKEDVEELVDVALESPNLLPTYTLKKVRSIAASRACRKSVMIGDALSWIQMTDIVSKMSNLKNPWVCAHNRPTIRHLMDVDWMDS